MQTSRQTDKQTDKQAHIHTYIHAYITLPYLTYPTLPTYLPSLSHTSFLCHTPSFTYNFVPHNCFYFSILHHLLCLSFLPRPATTFVMLYWKKLTCGVIRSCNFDVFCYCRNVTVVSRCFGCVRVCVVKKCLGICGCRSQWNCCMIVVMFCCHMNRYMQVCHVAVQNAL